MQINIKLVAFLRVDRFREQTRDYPPGTTIGQIIDDLAIPRNQLGMALLNGAYADFETAVRDGDTLALLPLVSGG